jgi:hypothetical protein
VVRHGETRRFLGPEARVAHAERLRDGLSDDLRQRLAGRLFQHSAEHVDGDRVAPGLARSIEERHAREAPHVLVQADAQLIESIRHAGLVIRRTGFLCELVAEPGRMSQELPDRDRRRCAARELRPKLGEPFRYGIVQRELSLIHQCERGSRHDRLGD